MRSEHFTIDSKRCLTSCISVKVAHEATSRKLDASADQLPGSFKINFSFVGEIPFCIISRAIIPSGRAKASCVDWHWPKWARAHLFSWHFDVQFIDIPIFAHPSDENNTLELLRFLYAIPNYDKYCIPLKTYHNVTTIYIRVWRIPSLVTGYRHVNLLQAERHSYDMQKRGSNIISNHKDLAVKPISINDREKIFVFTASELLKIVQRDLLYN